MNKIDKCIELINEVRLEQVKMNAVLLRNTQDVEKHIKRTDLLEKQVKKVFVFAIFSAGVITARFGPDIFKVLSVIL